MSNMTAGFHSLFSTVFGLPKAMPERSKSAVGDGKDKVPVASLKTERDVVDLIDGISSQIGSDRSMAAFFEKSLRDLSDLKDRIRNHDTRIAIIGITSSGKSTLMNAVLGAPMLPTRVGPSSSKQVLCGWDKNAEGEIVFSPESGKEVRRICGGADEIRATLEKYGDEKFNPMNCQQVDEIRVHAPGFRFNRDLVIIDTPGLDAYGLDQHKEVTMKLVLPTVDMVLFLTNVKCDSDAKNLEFIDNVTSDEKPLIVVQNKIDSIEPKISKNGIEKTVDDIRIEHRARLKKLLANAKKLSVRNAPVVQVSAKAPKWEETNLQELGRILDGQIRLNSEARIGRRVKQLSAIVAEMTEALKVKLAENDKSAKAQTAARKSVGEWESGIETLGEKREEISTEFRRRLSAIQTTRENLLSAIDKEYLVASSRWALGGDSGGKYRRPESLDSSIVNLKSQFESQTRDFNSFFSSAITEVQNATSECCRVVGLDESKTIRRSAFRSTHVSISASQKTVKHREKYQVKKSGLFGGCARLFGSVFGRRDWGYETRYRTVTSMEYDIESLVASINAAHASFVAAIQGQLETFESNVEFAYRALVDEVEAKKQSLEVQRKQTLSSMLAKSIYDRLLQIGQLAYSQSDVSIENVADEDRCMTQVRQHFTEELVPKYVKVVADYAHQLSFETDYAVLDSIVGRSGMDSVVVCGWDHEKIDHFKTCFLRKAAKVSIVDFNDKNTVLPSARSLVFLLVNAEQAGSFRGKIFGGGEPTKFIENVIESGKLVWVMDSVREHVSVKSSDSFVDACTEMFSIVDQAQSGKVPFEVMACDRDIYWSVILHDLYFNKAIQQSEVALQNRVAEISELFKLSDERRHMTGRYLSQFKAR